MERTEKGEFEWTGRGDWNKIKRENINPVSERFTHPGFTPNPAVEYISEEGGEYTD